jgi:hypothetical protein
VSFDSDKTEILNRSETENEEARSSDKKSPDILQSTSKKRRLNEAEVKSTLKNHTKSSRKFN